MATMMHLLKYLWANRVKFRVVGRIPPYLSQYFDATTHIPRRICVKTILVNADCKHWMVVVPANDGVDKRELQRALQVKHVDVVMEKDLETIIPDCEAGAIPPLGNLYGFPVIAEKSVSEKEEIAFNACSRTDFIVMKYEDYQRLTRPIIAAFAASSSFDRIGTTVKSISLADNIRPAAKRSAYSETMN